MLRPRSGFGTLPYNSSCPHTRLQQGFTNPSSREHTFCYAPYATGELGANITARLALCCNDTVAGSGPESRVRAPVEVVQDPVGVSRYGIDTNCFLSCNATMLETPEGRGVADDGELYAFWHMESCMYKPIEIRGQAENKSALNPYGIECMPRVTVATGGGAGVGGLLGSSKVGVAMAVLVAFALFSI